MQTDSATAKHSQGQCEKRSKQVMEVTDIRSILAGKRLAAKRDRGKRKDASKKARFKEDT